MPVTVPATATIRALFQDNRGFKSLLRINGFNADLSADSDVNSVIYTQVAAVLTALAAASNAKLVGASYGFDFDIAQEPTTETGTYQLVVQKAHLQLGDGVGAFMGMSIPAPKDALFETTTQDNLIVVNPGSTLWTNLQTALVAAAQTITPRGGHVGAAFFGGQLRADKPRRRRVLQGA